MNNVNEANLTWSTVINDFFVKRRCLDEEKYIKDLIKKLGDDNTNKLKKENQEKPIDFERRRIHEFFKIKEDLLECENYERKLKEITDKYEPREWIAKASKDAASVNFATHVTKLTHSKIGSPSIYDKIIATNTKYLTTSIFTEKIVDGAVTGNQFSPIFQFLELECNGVKLATELSNLNSEVFKPFAEETEYLEWNKRFSTALTSANPASHLLMKQIYFPVNHSSDEYHLLSNVISSSMAHAIFEQLFSDKTKKIQKFFKENKFLEFENRYFSRKAKLGVTASNHSNVSQLNGKRGGKLYLFSSAPPHWQSQLKPPINQYYFFDARLRHVVSKDYIDHLRDFLIRFDKIDISIKHPDRRKSIDGWVGRIVDDLLTYASTVQNMKPGWSATEGIRLKYEHQLFLDPYREDETFQSVRKTNEWQVVLCADFACWLNNILVGKDNQFSPQQEHTRMWISLIKDPLREYDELIRMEIKTGEISI